MRPLIALDWGTSALRAARIDTHGNVIEERALPRGILTVAPGGFPAVFQEAVAGWPVGRDTLFLLSGMVGSRQGWIEAPYCACPAGFADIAAALAWVEPGRIGIVPGLSCERDGVPDVMRGEETQVFGALALLGVDEGTFVLPGTHSKWASVRQGRIESFSTFMTGEFYALLRRHSILARTLPDGDGELDDGRVRARRALRAADRQPAARGLQRANPVAVRPRPRRGPAELPVGTGHRRGTALATGGGLDRPRGGDRRRGADPALRPRAAHNGRPIRMSWARRRRGAACGPSRAR